MRKFFWLYPYIIFLVSLCGVYTSVTYAVSYESVVGKIHPEQEPDFIRVAPQYIWWNNEKIIWMRRAWYYAFVLMAHEAKKAWIDLEIVSARRSYEDQIPLFTEYWLQRALPPGSSSHHYWHAVDLAGVLSWSKTAQWLQDNAARFWFCQSYDGISSSQGEELRHYEFDPLWFRTHLAQYRDTLYLELTTTNLITPGTIDKKTLFENYVYPFSHRCLDNYPSHIDDVITWIRFERLLDSNAPEMVVYGLWRYKSTFWNWFHALLPQEIRFLKKWWTIDFAPLDLYPLHLQNAFRYDEWFRTGIERLVLVRLKAHLMQYE